MSFSRAAVLCALIFCLVPALVRAQSVLESAEWTGMGSFDEPVNCIYFLPSIGDPVVGFVGTGDFEHGHAAIYRTSDSGHSWQQTSLPATPLESVTDILFKDDRTGWAATSTARDDRGAVYRTTDGGFTWTRTSAENAVFLGLAYSPASGLLFVGRGGLPPLVSIDLGQTWQPLLDGVVTSFGFVDDSIGFAAGAHRFMPDGATFAVTTDGGRTWRSTSLNAECYQPLMLPTTHEIYSLNEGSGLLYYSSDLGVSWDTIHTFASPEWWMTGCVRGNVCGRLYTQSTNSTKSGLIVSDDKGRSWTELRPTANDPPLSNTIDTRFWQRKDVIYVARYAPGNHELYRYRRTHTTANGTEVPYSIERSLDLVSPGCEYVDSTISIAYPNDCALATLTSVRFADSTHFQLLGESMPKRLQNITGLRIAYVPEDARPVTSSVVLHFQIGDATFLDTLKLRGSVARTLSRLTLSPIALPSIVVAGDTVSLQLALRDGLPVNSGLDSLSFSLSAPSDLFSMIDASAQAGWRVRETSLRDREITLTPPASASTIGQRVAVIRLRVMLSADSSATVGLAAVTWHGNDFSGCTTTEPSLVTIPLTRSRSCGDSQIEALMNSGSIVSLRILGIESAIDASVVAAGDRAMRVAIVNEVGEEVFSKSTFVYSGSNHLRIEKPTVSGAYYLVVDCDGVRKLQPFSIK